MELIQIGTARYDLYRNGLVLYGIPRMDDVFSFGGKGNSVVCVAQQAVNVGSTCMWAGRSVRAADRIRQEARDLDCCPHSEREGRKR